MKVKRKRPKSPELSLHQNTFDSTATESQSASQWVSLLLGLMMLMAPAMGVPNEEVLQDTLKSAIVSSLSLTAGLVFLWSGLKRPTSVTWHKVLWLPLTLAGYALFSMVWSHGYLAGAEAIRWFIFSIIVILCMNIRQENHVDRLIWGIHLGATIASVWTILQFLVNFDLFPQGPNPASTFVNRNFFAEYAVCALPYSLYLIVRSKSNPAAFFFAVSVGLIFVALMMAGTRSALIALIVLALWLLSLYGKNRKPIQLPTWNTQRALYAGIIVLCTTLILGVIPNGNPKLTEEFGRLNAIERSLGRALTMANADVYVSGSFSSRWVMWAATTRMISKNPIAGVGAGAWEVHVPLYQQTGSQLENDYYAHNEFLQLLAEYGLAGWLFLGGLFAYLSCAMIKTWKSFDATSQPRFMIHTTALTSLLMLMIVSNAGFPWRLAGTGALFAVSLGLLAASGKNFTLHGKSVSTPFILGASTLKLLLIPGLAGLLLAIYMTQRAITCERDLVRGIKLALTISKSGMPNDPHWDKTKEEMLTLIRSGIALNSHYRKLTPMAADELASWGDWVNAEWIWQSVLDSRPNVVAIITNISRANLVMGNMEKAYEYLERAKRLQPTAPAVRTLNVMYLQRSGQDDVAAYEIKQLFRDKVYDYDLVYLAYKVGSRAHDWPLMIQALELRIDHWPAEAVDGWLKLGDIFDKKQEVKDEGKALHAYRTALEVTPYPNVEITWSKIPEIYRSKLIYPTALIPQK